MPKPPQPELDLAGTCDCGSVSIRISGQPISMFQCACENCQRVSGSGHSSVVLMPADGVHVSGETQNYERPADSGATFTRHFCPRCGTTVCAGSSRAPAIRILPVGIFAGDNNWFTPNQLIFARSHADWDLVADHLPRHQRYRDAPG